MKYGYSISNGNQEIRLGVQVLGVDNTAVEYRRILNEIHKFKNMSSLQNNHGNVVQYYYGHLPPNYCNTCKLPSFPTNFPVISTVS